MGLRENVMDCFHQYNKLLAEREVLARIADAVKELPFGEHPSLPWCRESFLELDSAMKEYELRVES